MGLFYDRYGMIYGLALYGWDKEVDGLWDGITVWGSAFQQYVQRHSAMKIRTMDFILL